MKILLFGGSGKLGKAIREIDSKIISPPHKECDITNYEQVSQKINKINPEVIIHSAAVVGTSECEKNKKTAWKVNVEGTNNIVKICRIKGIKLVFISSSAIFDGKKGTYKEENPPTPTFYYAITKVAAEQAVKQLKSYAIIRLDFFPLNGLKYYKVFSDHFTSKIPVNEAAHKILLVANKKDFIGVINIGQQRNSLYDILKKHYPRVKPIKISKSSLPNFPKDISLDLSKWKKHFKSS